MGVSHSPHIVTDGLIRCYDSAKIVGLAGSSWHDLTANQNITLQASPSTTTYNGVDVLHFEKDSNQYATFDSNPLSGINGATAEFWIRFESVQGSATAPYYQLIIFESCVWIAQYAGKIGIDLNSGSGWFDGAGGTNTGAQVPDTGTITTGVWYNPCFAWGGGVVNCYMNGALQRSKSIGSVTSLPAGTTPRQLGRRGGGTTQFDGDFAIARLYSKQLTHAEVEQNHNALKGRFGL